MVLRDRMQEFKDSLPRSPNGNSGRWKPLWPTAADYDRLLPDPTVSDRAYRCPPPDPLPLGMAAGVYRYMDRHHRLLYIGQSTNPRRRHGQHQADRHNKWWQEVDHLLPIEWHETVAGAKAAEARSMETQHPLYNDRGIWAEHRFHATTGLCPCGVKINWAQGVHHDWTGPKDSCAKCHVLPECNDSPFCPVQG